MIDLRLRRIRQGRSLERSPWIPKDGAQSDRSASCSGRLCGSRNRRSPCSRAPANLIDSRKLTNHRPSSFSISDGSVRQMDPPPGRPGGGSRRDAAGRGPARPRHAAARGAREEEEDAPPAADEPRDEAQAAAGQRDTRNTTHTEGATRNPHTDGHGERGANHTSESTGRVPQCKRPGSSHPRIHRHAQ